MIRLACLSLVAACLTFIASNSAAEAQIPPYYVAPAYGYSGGFWDNDYNPYGTVYGRGIRKAPRGYQTYRPYHGSYYTDRWYR